ncbi:MAG: hypothetical protein JSS00_00615 [Proteobacteria bacterium]|nr:hypothetical protein [Pseudomonadota bacterium]
MTIFRTVLLVVAAAATLAACQTTPTYSAAVSPNAAGYSEQQIESNRYTVTYRAPGGADAQTLQDYALLRAADLTLEHNRDWFWVDRRNTSGGGYHSGPSVGIGVGGASFGHRTGVGVGAGFSFPIGGGGPTATSASLDIRFGEGPKPDDPNAYDARSIAANLRARQANK